MIGAGARPNSSPYRSTRPFGGGTTLLDVTLTSGLPSGGTRPEGVGVRRRGRARPYHECYSAARKDLHFPSFVFCVQDGITFIFIDCRVISFITVQQYCLLYSVNQNKNVFLYICVFLPLTNHPHFPFPPTLQNLRRPRCHFPLPLPLMARG